jgi:hypothetical protein
MYQRIAQALAGRISQKDLMVDDSWGDMCIEIGMDVKWNECLFDHCGDLDCRDFMLSFLHGELNKVGFSTAFELAKLLAMKGVLIKEEAEAFLLDVSILDSPPLSLSLFWAYLGSSKEYESICIRLLDGYREDFRDGVFLACYYLNTPCIYRSLIEHFSKWIAKPEWGNGTGEMGALEEFLAKWDQTHGFNEHRELHAKYLERQ